MNRTEDRLLTSAAVGSETDGSKRRRVGSSGNEVSDAEVEEFYAILRRIRTASRTSRPAQSPVTAWNPCFAPEDFGVGKDDKDCSNCKEGVLEVQSAGGKAPAVRRPLDLNADPEPEI